MVLLLVLFCTLAPAAWGERHHKVESMYMSRTSGSDLAPSATGYIYRDDNNGPPSYVQLGPGAVHHHLTGYPGVPLPLQNTPNTFAAYNVKPAVPANQPVIAPIYTPQVPLAHLAANVGVLGSPIIDKVSEEIGSNDASDEGEEGYVSDESDGGDYEADFDDGIGFAGDSDHHGHSFSNGGGKSYSSSGHSSHGGKGDKGYKSSSHFDKGEKGKYGKEGHEGHYGEKGGHKSGHYDKGGEYSKHHEASKGYKGGSFGEKKGHSKGSKTTGFHNVYHKDEFKKEHDFYDDAHNSGHFNKHGSADSDHHSAKGGYSKGGKHDSAYSQGEQGKQGYSDKGHAHSQDQGHASKAGHEGYYNHHSDYAKKGGHAAGKEYGYADKH